MVYNSCANIRYLFKVNMELLSVTPAFGGWGPDFHIETVNGWVRLRQITLLVSYFHPNGNMIVAPFHEPFAVHHERRSTDIGSKRLVGSSCHRHLFIGSSPRGNDELAVANHKNGLKDRLPM
ncbi:hypothetical protein BJ508DRAFT_336568 [Ascobolus immersus RN42]|uniref:Uncharacterized protein n=1 Tax=Ascobolus immersus RN42 TaxID=1160509 RepID=A0A3N4H800_ASCIM|nr:hypothetical protein BJ508DRAFT_336568 [Ascobolus immersus RN42]